MATPENIESLIFQCLFLLLFSLLRTVVCIGISDYNILLTIKENTTLTIFTCLHRFTIFFC